METKKSKNNDNNNEKKDIEGNNNDRRRHYTYDSSDAKEIMTGVVEKVVLFLILINILLKTSRNLLKRKRIDLVKRVMQKVVQSNQIIKMKIIELFIFTTSKLLIKVH